MSTYKLLTYSIIKSIKTIAYRVEKVEWGLDFGHGSLVDAQLSNFPRVVA